MTTHLCKSCLHFCQYYIKSYSGFKKISRGYCNEFKNIRSDEAFCEMWIENSKLTEERNIKNLENLQKAAESIVQIAQILKDEKEEYGKGKA